MNLAELVHSSAEKHGDRAAVTDVGAGRSLGYEGLARETERVASFLTAQGVEPGQRIGLIAPNSLAHLPAAFGLLATGACLTPIAVTLPAPERDQILSEIGVNGCLVWPGSDALSDAGAGAVLSGGECAGFGFQWIDRDARPPAGFGALDAAFVRFTSGTTAHSKGVVLSHEATLARVEAADRVLGLGPEDRILWVLPLAYHFAVTVTAYVRAGAHMLLCPDSLPATIVRSARSFGASVLYASPLHFDRLSRLPSSGPLASLRIAMSTSAPITADVMDRFESRYGVPVAQAYGLIEAGLPCINLRRDGTPARSVGRAVPGYEVAVFSDSGERLAAGTAGEVGVRGDGLFSAYYAPWRLREQVVRDGWFLTGDVGWLDVTGALHLEGRKKAVIFVAGLKFFPEEVEECVNRFPGIRESRVFGQTHSRLGQVPRAEIVLASPGCDLEALRQ
ncbi:MAG TPA: class I adenylate-forming enzyme family protein, partial [Candidatus Methylomirabilis sp.]|nr:class I adenylate-forming enzyme family protein [Candidatus Methylomirabilis sp.]